MSEGERPPKIADIAARLQDARRRRGEEAGDIGGSKLPAESGAGVGYRVSVELFAGMLFGGGLGWLLDRWLGTKPWLMFVMFLLGAAAGLLNSYRAVMGSERPATKPEASKNRESLRADKD
jgi:ATP synthase protein I